MKEPFLIVGRESRFGAGQVAVWRSVFPVYRKPSVADQIGLSDQVGLADPVCHADQPVDDRPLMVLQLVAVFNEPDSDLPVGPPVQVKVADIPDLGQGGACNNELIEVFMSHGAIIASRAGCYS